MQQMQGTCDFHVWVDDGVTVAEKRSLKKVERELRKVRSEFLSATATSCIFRESQKFITRQLANASRAELLWMALFMITLLMYMVHMMVVVK